MLLLLGLLLFRSSLLLLLFRSYLLYPFRFSLPYPFRPFLLPLVLSVDVFRLWHAARLCTSPPSIRRPRHDLFLELPRLGFFLSSNRLIRAGFFLVRCLPYHLVVLQLLLLGLHPPLPRRLPNSWARWGLRPLHPHRCCPM